jgi:hypothetical protein
MSTITSARVNMVQPIARIARICLNCKHITTERQNDGTLVLKCNGIQKEGINKCQSWEKGRF